MKKMLLLLTVFSLSFCGTVYISYDVGTGGEVEGSTFDDFDKGALMVGYNHGVHQSDDLSMAIGANYSLSPWTDELTGYKDLEVTSYNVYLLTKKDLSGDLSIWGTLGYGMADDDNWFRDYIYGSTSGISSEVNGGLMYGLGFGYAVSETMSVGLGYSMNNYELEFSDGINSATADIEVDRTFLYAAYSF